jgi:hypothetical protein
LSSVVLCFPPFAKTLHLFDLHIVDMRGVRMRNRLARVTQHTPRTTSSALNARNFLPAENHTKAPQKYAITRSDFRKSGNMGLVDEDFDCGGFDSAFVSKKESEAVVVLIPTHTSYYDRHDIYQLLPIGASM